MKKLILTILTAPIITYLIFEAICFNATYPNIYLGEIPVGMKNKNELKQLITTELQNREQRTLSFDTQKGKPIAITLNTNILKYNIDETIEKILNYGKRGTIQEQITQKLQLIQGVQINPEYQFDELTFDTLLADQIRQYESPVIDSKIIIENGKLVITPSKAGNVANRQEIIKKVQDYINLKSNQILYTVEIKKVEPKITRENSAKALELAQRLSTKQIELYSPLIPDTTQTIEQNELINFLEFRFDEEKNEQTVSFANYKIASFSAELSSRIYQEPKDAKIETAGKRTIIIEPAQEGRTIDIEKLTEKITQAAYQPSFSVKIEIPIKPLRPAITQAAVDEMGIKALIATGQSRYVGSSPGRIHNIAVASEKLNGALIRPGETFSLYKTIGEIEKSTGYQDSYIIKNGRTVIGVGGGVCQVSTTLFRAALNAGFPIIERAPHSYRVAYYEQDSPPGFDAAIYFPTLDLRFQNNSPSNVIIQVKRDDENTQLTINLYGEPDGRTVTISPPEIINETTPPPEIKINDPTLKIGQIKQVEFASKGATVIIKRNVTKNGQTIINDTIKSFYSPWQAVTYIGTRQ